MIGQAYFVGKSNTANLRSKVEGSIFDAVITITKDKRLGGMVAVNFQYSEDSSDIAFSIPLLPLHGYEVTRENWFHLLDHERRGEALYRTPKDPFVIDLCKASGFRIDYFSRYMYIDVIGDPYNYGVIVDRGEEFTIPKGAAPRTTPFVTPGGVSCSVWFNDRGVELMPIYRGPFIDVKPTSDTYRWTFDRPLTPKQILEIMVTGKRDFEIKPGKYAKRPEDNLTWKGFGPFHYLQSDDGLFKIATQKGAMFLATEAVYQKIDGVASSKKDHDIRTQSFLTNWRDCAVADMPQIAVLRLCADLLDVTN